MSSARPILLNLPAELRTTIYHLVTTPVDVILHTPGYGGLRWLAAFRPLFIDAAPLYYSKATFTVWDSFATVKARRTISGDFEKHLRLTYGPQALNDWLPQDARSFIKHIQVQLTGNMLLETLSAYFRDIRDFPNLQSLMVIIPYETTEFFIAYGGTVHPEKEAVSTVPAIEDSIQRLKQILHDHCELRVRYPEVH